MYQTIELTVFIFYILKEGSLIHFSDSFLKKLWSNQIKSLVEKFTQKILLMHVKF